MKCVICEQEHEKVGLEYCVAALVRRNQELERKYADWRTNGVSSVECNCQKTSRNSTGLAVDAGDFEVKR